MINEFVDTHKVGTVFGDLLITRYLGSAARLHNPGSAEDLRRFRATARVFQRYGRQYPFDWLVIAAQAYQESRLDQGLRGRAGAVGVMQITPATAAGVGIRDVTTVDDNVHAGVKYLRFVADRYYADEPVDRPNKALFAFASYKAGPERVQRLRAKAHALGLSPNCGSTTSKPSPAREVGREMVDYVGKSPGTRSPSRRSSRASSGRSGAPAPAPTPLVDGLGEAELLDAVADLIAVQAEQRRRPRLVAAAALERLDDQAALELLEIDALGRQRDRRAPPCAWPPAPGSPVGSSHVALGEQHGALDGVAQLADVARPAVGAAARAAPSATRRARCLRNSRLNRST